MDNENDSYLYEEFVIFNFELGLRAYVFIGDIETYENKTIAWLEEPYEMVGPFNLNILLEDGKIEFEQCIVMTKQTWQSEQTIFRKISYEKQQAFNKHFNETINEYNRRKQQSSTYINEKEYRELLELPIDGVLEVIQIKAAYKKIVKKVHPDVGGSHEAFIELTIAKDFLIQKFKFDNNFI